MNVYEIELYVRQPKGPPKKEKQIVVAETQLQACDIARSRYSADIGAAMIERSRNIDETGENLVMTDRDYRAFRRVAHYSRLVGRPLLKSEIFGIVAIGDDERNPG